MLMDQTILSMIHALDQRVNGMYMKDFLLTWDKEKDDLILILELAATLKKLRERNVSVRVFDTGLGISNFRDNSTRTRFSFASACNLLGMGVQDLDEEKSQISHGETVRETAVMISFLADFIGIRDDIYLGEGNRYMREVAAALDESVAKGVLTQRPGIINLQCDMDHPTQSLSDLLHLQNAFGSLEALKNKRIVMSWAYSPSYGKPLSVPQGIITLMTRFGMHVRLAYPDGYGLIPEVMSQAADFASEHGGSFTTFNSMDKAMQDAHVVYPKSWAPYHVMEQRTQLLMSNDKKGLADLEQECLENNARFSNWTYTQKLKDLTNQKNALYMHCLPADISGVSCIKGEVDADVFETHRLQTYMEAGYKPYIIAAMMLSYRYKSPANVLRTIVERNQTRVLYE